MDILEQSGVERERGRWGLCDSGKRQWAAFSCPQCGEIYGIGSHAHAIDGEGNVSPSFVCTTAGCTFHENLRLVGWRHGRVDPVPRQAT